MTLSPEEQTTLDSYAKIVLARSKAKDDPNFWLLEFTKFKTYLPDGKIIDIGCGSGRDATLFIQNGYEYRGIDLSDEMLALARQAVPIADFRKMNMYDLNFPDKMFDGFWAVTSLLHILKRKMNTVLEEIHRVVKFGGIGFIVMKHGEGERMVTGKFEGDNRFYSFYRDYEFCEILERNRFRVLEYKTDFRSYDPPHHSDIWLIYFVEAI